MKHKRSHLRSLLVIASMFLMCASTAQADIILGSFNFNSLQFGDTLVESDTGTWSAQSYLNTFGKVDPENPRYLTGADFITGIANIGADLGSVSNVSYTIGYDTPIVNHAGADFGVVVARFSTDSFYLALSVDGTNFTADRLIDFSSAVATGVSKSYYVKNGIDPPVEASLWVHPIDISDFRFLTGASITAVRITGITQLDLIRAAGFATVPLPPTVLLLGSGLLGLAGWRRLRKG
jgi:hypothetical protein